MKKFIRHILALALLTAGILAAGAPAEPVLRDGSFLRQLQERDSILIGDQLLYGFRVDGLPVDTRFALPDFSEKGLCDSVVLVRGWVVDTTRAKNGTVSLEASVVITSFDAGLYELPPLAMLTTRSESASAAPDTLVFKPKVLDVRTLPIDPETYEPHDIRPQIRYPVTFREILPWLLGFWLVSLLLILAVALYLQHRRRAIAAPKPDDPAHIVALRELDKYRGNKFWAPERQKVFYSGVTDALRGYIAARYGVSALERTTAEIFDDLKGTDVPKDLYAEAKELFEVSDFVKFAKLTVPEEEAAKVLPAAVRFVTGTYQEEIEKEEDGHVL